MKLIVIMADISMSNFRTLDLNLLRVLGSLMETGNVTRTSEALGLTQPAVSSALSRLRNHIGDPLFVRVGNGMVPTARAEELRRPVEDALRSLAIAIETTSDFDPATAEVTFTLRGADFFSMRLMPVLAGRLAVEAPGVVLRYLDSGYGNMAALIEDGSVDLALEQPLEVPGWISVAPLFCSPFVVAAARGNAEIRAAGVKEGEVLPFELFCGLPHALRSMDGSMSGMTDTALAKRGMQRRVALVLPHFEAIAMAVARSRMISVIPVQLASEVAEMMGLAIYQAPFEIPAPTMKLYWHSRFDSAAPHVWLRRRVLDQVVDLWGTGEGAA